MEGKRNKNRIFKLVFEIRLKCFLFSQNLSIRNLSLLECRSKEILQKFDVNIQKFRVVNNVNDAAKLPELLSKWYSVTE